ncbi:TetR/AcrR family transcriptional regulator [Pseudomonas sp. CGJS7]|uniref:TetR/AcrR family transcriptional regulator n=1 Tax=Pseudomonas sp. CGJS7 TaxID=3109348 RepID=UPI00300AC5D5
MIPPIPDPDPGRRERKRQQTLDHLAATAFALFERQGFDAVTMEQIAAEADVAKGTLYNHFPVKEALLAHQFHGEIARGAQGLAASLAERESFVARLSGWLQVSADWCQSRRPYLPHYLRFRFMSLDARTRGRDPSRSGMERLFQALIEAAQGAGEVRADLPAEHLAALLQHLYLGALMRWVAVDDDASQERSQTRLENEFAAVVDLFVHGAGRAQERA